MKRDVAGDGFQAWRPVVWTCAFYLCLAAISVGGANAEHFTWVSIGVVSLYAFAEMIQYGHHFFWMVQAIQFQVIAGVLIMAFDNCDVFEDAHDSNGDLVYIFGNTAMHYAPSAFVYAMATTDHIFCGLQRALRQVWVAFMIYLSWYYFESPWRVYGCNLPEALGILGTLAIKIVFTILVSFVQERAPHRKPPRYEAGWGASFLS